jgi:hypothetical protein
MIIKENITIDGREFTRTYSDQNMKIRKVGTDEIYADAIDVLDFEYDETDTPLETPAPTETDMREALGILGVNL